MQRIGIVIVNFNGRTYISDCLQSVGALTYRPDIVVVVDNASTDGSADLIARDYPEVVLIRNQTNAGFSAGTNLGIRYCLDRRLDAVLLLNPDTVVSPTALHELVSASQRHPYALVAPAIYSFADPETSASYAGRIVWWRGRTNAPYHGRPRAAQPKKELQVGTANGCCLLVPSEVIRRIGLLEEAYFLYFEDVDYIERAVRAGFEVWYVPSSEILHRESSATGGSRSPLAMYHYVRNRHYFVRKFRRGRPTYLAFLAYSVVDVSTRVVWFTLQGRLDLTRAVIRATAHAWGSDASAIGAIKTYTP